IHEFKALNLDGQLLSFGDGGTVDLNVRVICSAGTYVRTLAEDLGARLGVGAHLATLRRTRAGRFAIESGITLERLAELAETNSVADQIISLDSTIAHLPAVVMNEGDVKRVTNGLMVEIDSDHPDEQRVRLQNVAGELIAVGIYDATRRVVHPGVVL